MSQESDILYHLHYVGGITPLDPLDLYGCFRLAPRIQDLRKKGHKNESTTN